MVTLDNIKVTLEKMGLNTHEFPGLMVPILFWFIALESIVGTFALARAWSVPVFLLHPGLIVLSALLGLIAYTIGSIWDDKVFDPLYGLRGKWLSKRTRPFSVFPPGSDLERYRSLAIEALKPTSKGRISQDGEGIYRVAKESIVTRREWDKVSSVLSWSKAFRSLICPLLILGVICLCLSVGSFLIFSWVGNPLVGMLIAVICIAFALLSFIPYLEWRVEHLISMYDIVSRTP